MRFHVAPLVLLAACSRAPDMATCRLVGTWERRMILPPEARGAIPDYVTREPVPGVTELAMGVETFGGDGRWSTIIEQTEMDDPTFGNVVRIYFARSDRVGFTPFDRPVQIEGEWRLRSETPTRIEIEIRDPRRSHPVRRTLDLRDDGTMGWRDGDWELRLVYLPTPKSP